MDELAQTLLSFINNPENKEQIEKIKEKFMGLKSVQNEKEEKNAGSSAKGPESKLNISPEMLNTISKVMPLITSAKKDDANTKFLSALRPLLNEKRQLKLDESMKIMQLIKVLPMLKDNGIF